MARQSREVKGVVYEVDSYGGEVNGGFETARDLARLSAEKPTISILTISPTRPGICSPPSTADCHPRYGGAGSIGVIMIHADYSQALDNAGIHLTIIRAGKQKADGNPYEPLNADLAAKWQAQADAMRQGFRRSRCQRSARENYQSQGACHRSWRL